jgi:hypothetical protein
MFKKSVFIMLFVCLLATVSSAVTMPVNWWDYQLEWKGGTDGNWANPANWTPENLAGIPPATGPEPNNRCAVLPNQPGPRIYGNATCLILELNPWDPTPWGTQDVNLTITATATDVNFGSAIQINSEVSYDSYLGTPNLASRAIVNVYGGTVTTPGPYVLGTATNGIQIGGGSDNYGLSYGMLNIYGGIVNVPRLGLHFGEIGLYGGTLICASDTNFVVTTDHPLAALNKIRIDGGTFTLLGDHTTDINTLRAGGFVVCDRGTLRDPVYDGTWTTLIADINYCVWQPSPANGATNVHYKVNSSDPNDPCSITLSWTESSYPANIDANDDIYFGTSFADVNIAIKGSPQYKGSRNDDNSDPCSFTIKDPNKFNLGTTYYWRVDENSVSNGFKKGLVWSFTTHDGKAYNPKPADDANLKPLSLPLQLSWSSGDWAAVHRVFFGTNIGEVGAGTITKTTGVYRGTVTDPVYPLSRLAETAAPAYKAWTLVAGQTYYWRIDEVNGATVYGGPSGGAGQVPSPSPTWSFTPAAYINIDDFEEDQSTDDVNAAWLFGYTITHTGADSGCNSATAKGYAGRLLVRDSSGKYMQYTFNNDGTNPAFSGSSFSEAKRAYSTATSFTGGGVFSPAVRALRIDYLGRANDANNGISGSCPAPLGGGDLDRMYVAIEDSAGDVAIYLNPDPNAQLVTSWTSWYTALTDINDIAHGTAPNGSAHTVNLEAITGFAIGFGIRGDTSDTDFADENSVVMFDNIRLYASTCIPSYAQAHGLSADLDGDCDVDINDLDAFSNNWLWAAAPQHSITTTVPHKAPVIWYKFNESSGVTAADSASGYTADVCGVVAWEPAGGRNGAGCITLNSLASNNSHVEVRNPNTAFGFLNSNDGSISLSVWINADASVGNTMNNSWESFFTVYDSNWNERTSFSIPWRWGDPHAWLQSQSGNTALGPLMPDNYFGGRWNHWAAIKDAGTNTMFIYGNGSLVGSTASTTPLFTLPVQSIRIGMRGASNANWGKWSGKVQDFKVYDYALDANEVAYLATDNTGVVGLIPLVSPANLKKGNDPNTEIVNFSDVAIMGQQWHTQILWP